MPPLPLYTQQYDFNKYLGYPSKIICFWFIPRSGSNLLADLARQTNLIGYPLEYFSPNSSNLINPDMAHRLTGFDQVIEARTSSNGVFSFKFNSNFFALKQKLFNFLKVSHHIYLDREDREGQAISFAKAKKSNTWINLRENPTSSSKIVKVTPFEVNDAMEKLEECRTKTLSEVSKTDFLRVDYEEIISEPAKALTRIFQYCEIKKIGEFHDLAPQISLPSKV